MALYRRRLLPLPGGKAFWLGVAMALLLFWLLRLTLGYGFGVEGILGFPALP